MYAITKIDTILSKSTFTRIVKSGKNLTMEVQIIRLRNHDNLSGKQIQTICSALGNHHNIAATPYRINGMQAIAVNARVNIPCNSKQVENNRKEMLTVDFDFSPAESTLRFSNPSHRQMLADLYVRNLVIRVNNTKIYKRISSDSHRIFYVKEAFRKERDIGAFQRFALSDVIIDEVGIGVNVEASTAFFSLKSVAQYYKDGKQERLFELMDRMSLNTNSSSNQGRERRGTLTFYAPNRIQTCYFEKIVFGETCGSPYPNTIEGVRYENLTEYYKKHKGYISDNDPVAVVSFRELSNVRVPANKLYVRVFNDKLPRELVNVDKIEPEFREKDINLFWDSIGKNPNGNDFNDFEENRFYKPSSDRSGIIKLPGLMFGKNSKSQNVILAAPHRLSINAYRNHFQNRKRYLDRYGCYHVPPTIEQEIHFPFPQSANLSETLKDRLASDVCIKVGKLTNSDIDYRLHDYNNHIEAAYTLKQETEDETGMTVFTFNSRSPASYYQISSELSDWGLKRLTVKELRRKYNDLQRGKKNKWDAYIDLIAYDVIQEMNCVPWVLTRKLNYNIHLAIDVSEKFRYYNLSLMVQNEDMPFPILINNTYRKTDDYRETINAEFLEDGIRSILEDAKHRIGDTLNSKNMLIYRDGKDCEKEFLTIQKIIPNLIDTGLRNTDLEWDFVEYRKSMMQNLRIYDSNKGKAERALEGSYFDVHTNDWTIITTTGAATVRQGTPKPISVKNTFTNGDLSKIREDLFLTSQYNFSSPSVAQRLSQPLKKADEELQKKMAEEVKGLRVK